MSRFLKLKNFILDVLFPAVCLNCRRPLDRETEKFVCGRCLGGIVLNTSLFCPVCKLRLADNRKVCHKDSQYLLAAAANYGNETVRNLIWFFKYQKWSGLQTVLSGFLIRYLDSLNLPLEDYSVLPIPLSPERQRERGFNQAELLAKNVADRYRINLLDSALKRIRPTEIQAELKNEEQRKQNVAGCFSVSRPELISEKNILLVDDVHTSGATISEAAKALRLAGAKKIIALVIAKA